MRTIQKRYVIYRTPCTLDGNNKLQFGSTRQFWAVVRTKQDVDRIVRNSWKYGESFAYGYTEREIKEYNK